MALRFNLVTKYVTLARLAITLEIFDFGHVPMVINAAACQPSSFCFVLAAKHHRRHFGAAETVQSPARFETASKFPISATFQCYYYAYLSRNEVKRHNNVLENVRNLRFRSRSKVIIPQKSDFSS